MNNAVTYTTALQSLLFKNKYVYILDKNNLSTINMTLKDYIKTRYGTQRGSQADFLRDNPLILPQELTRWIKTHSVNMQTGEIYKPSSKKIIIKEQI